MLKVKTIPVGELMTNCYIISDEASGISAVIDPGSFTKKLDKAISKVGYDKIKYIILTHGHYDHIGGVNEILARTDFKAEIAVGEYDVPLLSNSTYNLSSFFENKPIDNIKANISLSEGDIITIGESNLRVLHTPGHTQGSICLVGEGVIFSGDTLFRCSMGRTDFPTGNSGDMARSLKRLASLDGDYTVYPGHNDSTTFAYEKHNNPYV